jgi:hypothetical protein
LTALFAVFIGACIGRQIPLWMGWKIDAMTLTVAGAVVIGLSGFIYHRVWAAIGMGLTLSVWGAFIAWIGWHGTATWFWPVFDDTQSLTTYAIEVWRALPPDVARVLPFICGAGFLSGLVPVLLWPRVGCSIMYSMLGLTMATICGLSSMNPGLRFSVQNMSVSAWLQVPVWFSLITMGALVQWRLTPDAPTADAEDDSEDDDEEGDDGGEEVGEMKIEDAKEDAKPQAA